MRMIKRGEVSCPLHIYMTTHVGSNAGNLTSISPKERATKPPEEWHVIYLPVSIYVLLPLHDCWDVDNISPWHALK